MGFPVKSNQNKPSSKGMPMVPAKGNVAKGGKLPAKMPKPFMKKAGK